MSDREIIGQTGAVTGFETPDPKDSDPTVAYTTTPAADRVSGSDQSDTQPMPAVDPGAVTHQFDALATRDVTAMEHAPQAPEYAGAQSVAGLDTSALDGLAPAAGLGLSVGGGLVASELAAADLNLAARDPNSGYTPPSQMTPPHVMEGAAGLPADEPEELQDEMRGNGNLR